MAVAWTERSEIRCAVSELRAVILARPVPDFASLDPGDNRYKCAIFGITSVRNSASERSA